MRTFWQTIALLLLVLFAPASMHCLMGGPADLSHPVATVAAQDECDPHSTLPCHQEQDGPTTPEHQEHDCPTDTLAKSSLPVAVSVPAVPCTVLEDALAALRRMADELTSSGEALMAAPSVAPKELQPTWAFTSRAALPARWPSDLA